MKRYLLAVGPVRYQTEPHWRDVTSYFDDADKATAVGQEIVQWIPKSCEPAFIVIDTETNTLIAEGCP